MTFSDRLHEITVRHKDKPAAVWRYIGTAITREQPTDPAEFLGDQELVDFAWDCINRNICHRAFFTAAFGLDQGNDKLTIWNALKHHVDSNVEERPLTVSGFDATPEQLMILDHGREGKNLMVEAGAGASKTSTLVALCEHYPSPTIYLAFNKVIVEEGKKVFPEGVVSRTLHAQALREFPRSLRSGFDPEDKEKTYWCENEVARRFLGSPDLLQMVKQVADKFEDFIAERKQGLSTQARAKAIARGFYAAYLRQCEDLLDEKEATEAIKNALAIKTVTDKQEQFFNSLNEIRNITESLNSFSFAVWRDFIDGQAKGCGFNEVIRWYGLHGGLVNENRLLVDEVQDTNDIMLEIVKRNARGGKQVILVGDSGQAIYGWNGSKNSFLLLDDVCPWQKLTLATTFRCGPAVTELANGILNKADHSLRLKPKGPGNTKPHMPSLAGIARTNGGTIKLAAMLMKLGKKVWAPKKPDTSLFWSLYFLRSKGQQPKHSAIAEYTDWNAIYADFNTGQLEQDVAVAVKIIETADSDFFEALKLMKDGFVDDPAEADFACMTAHASKGLEFEYVVLGDDFSVLEDDDPSLEELNILYVAVTRAMRDVLPSKTNQQIKNLGRAARPKPALVRDHAVI